MIEKMANAREPPPDATPETSGERRASQIEGQYSAAPSEYRVTVQVPEHPNGRFHLLVHFEPTLWPEFMSIRTPQILVPAMRIIG